MTKRFDSSLDNRRVYKIQGSQSTELQQGSSLRSLKGIGTIPRKSTDHSNYNDNFKSEEYSLDKGKNGRKNFESNDYRSLHEKLNMLENKILKMKSNIEKKREDKKEFLQLQQRQRHERQRRRQQVSRSPLKTQNSLKSMITQVQPAALKGLVTQVPQQKDLKYFDFNPYSPRSNIYYVSQITKAYKQDRSIAREHLLNSMQLLKTLEHSKKNAPQMKALNLIKHPHYKDKKTVIFDLDQTLIHCNQSVNLPYDIKLPIRFPTGQLVEAGINIRPYAKQLLRNLSSKFQIIVFTASHSCYANVVLDYLDPQNQYIKHRLYRQHCYLCPQGMYVKDLRIINRPLSDMVLVDNAAYSYAYQIDNGIPILPFYEGKHDFELVALEKYLDSLLFSKDVRDQNRKTFKLHLYNTYNDINKLVNDLYLSGR